jgi:hypothetical protein
MRKETSHLSSLALAFWEVHAYGHAGFNDAFWGGSVDSSLIVEAGSAYTVKLSRPETACLVVE